MIALSSSSRHIPPNKPHRNKWRGRQEGALPFTQSTEFWAVSFSIPSGLGGMKENKRGEKLLRHEVQTDRRILDKDRGIHEKKSE